jgi:hypothetical protein
MNASNFISSFKIDDNVNHNFAILRLLYDAYEIASPSAVCASRSQLR